MQDTELYRERSNLAETYLLKFSKIRNTRKSSEICSRLTKKTQKLTAKSDLLHSGVFIPNFEQLNVAGKFVLLSLLMNTQSKRRMKSYGIIIYSTRFLVIRSVRSKF